MNMPANHPNALGAKLAQRFFLRKTQGNQKTYYDLETGQEDLQMGHLVGVLCSEGCVEYKTAVDIVRQQYFRPISSKVVYRPYGSPVVNVKGLWCINQWRVPDVKPDATLDAQRFFFHLMDVLGDVEKVNYLLDMLSYRYQQGFMASSVREQDSLEVNGVVDGHEGAIEANSKRQGSLNKPHIAFYFYGEQGGAGKSTFAETLTKVFGDTAVKTTNTVNALKGKGAVDLWKSTWLVVEEAKVSKGTQLYDAIKSYTGDDYVHTDRKFGAVAKEHIPAQLIMLSNRPPMFLEEHDRRFFVANWSLDIESSEDRAEYFRGYRNWLENDGYEAIAGLLKTRVVTANVFEDAPITDEKKVATLAQFDPAVLDVKEYLESNEDRRLFEMKCFDDIWKNYWTKSSERKHKLFDAGLVFHGRTKIGNKQPAVWHRDVDTVVSSGGSSGVQVKLPNGTLVSATDAYGDPRRDF